jgi:hypothetical protein
MADQLVEEAGADQRQAMKRSGIHCAHHKVARTVHEAA